ncbi:MAG: acetylglutamate kinase [Thermoplasmata archaeon]|jgi:acetylglutamate kinase|nr:acetylglutamate kinase [Thermoplasmata archaeon]
MENIYVLKFGGNAIRGRDDLMRLSKEIAGLIADGARIVLVHGGGPEISEEMERRGMTPKKVSGVRVTDEAGLEVAELVLRRLNGDVVSCLQECGVTAIGMPGYMCTVCRRKTPVKAVEDGVEKEVDLGLVGEVEDTDPNSILDLLEQGITPVIYPIGKDARGTMLNVNADTMVAGIAAGVRCREMITITDVPGILRDVNDPSSKINTITLAEVDALIADGTISGGMIPKVEACRSALLAGVSVVRMVNGKDPRSIVSDVMKNTPHGTVITK